MADIERTKEKKKLRHSTVFAASTLRERTARYRLTFYPSPLLSFHPFLHSVGSRAGIKLTF